MKSAIVVTPTTGSLELVDAARSVLSQDYDNLEYLIVVDGPQFANATWDVLMSADINPDSIHTTVLPFNTGGGGYYGHRIMAATSHLVRHDYVLFLDQDNWIEPNHVSSLVNCCEENNVSWSHSLRNIYSKGMQFICPDNCESLGKWPIAGTFDCHLIDTSTYCFSLQFLKRTGHLWDSRWGADRNFYSSVKSLDPYACSGKYTLNYRLGGNEGSVPKEFFINGNHINSVIFNSKYPWQR